MKGQSIYNSQLQRKVRPKCKCLLKFTIFHTIGCHGNCFRADVCMRSRAHVNTGRKPWEHSILSNWEVKAHLRKLWRMITRGCTSLIDIIITCRCCRKSPVEKKGFVQKCFFCSFWYLLSLHEPHSKVVCQHWPKSAHLEWTDSLGFHDPSLNYPICYVLRLVEKLPYFCMSLCLTSMYARAAHLKDQPMHICK